MIFSVNFIVRELALVFRRDGVELEASRVETDGVFFATYVLHLYFMALSTIDLVALTGNVACIDRLVCGSAVGGGTP